MNRSLVVLLISGLVTLPVPLLSNPHTPNIMEKFLTCGIYPGHILFDGRFILNFKDNIQLSSHQKKMIENKMISFQEYSISSCADIKIRELHLASFLKSEKIDRKEVARLIREISNQRIILSIQYLNYILDIKSLLTSKQILRLKEIKKNFRQKFR